MKQPTPRVAPADAAAFEQLVAEALDGIPEEFAPYLENVAVVVEEEPSEELLQQLGLDPRRDTLFGLYRGLPLPHRSHDFWGAPPDHITIYRGPLRRAYPGAQALREQIRRTIVHEIAHFFGLDEGHIQRLGY